MTPHNTRWTGGAALLIIACLGCASGALGTRTVRTQVYQEGGVRVFLRHLEQGGEPMAMGFSQPRTISSIRVSRVLTHIDVRERSGKEEKASRNAAVSAELAAAMGEGISKALEEANPNQEVVVMATETRRRLGLFNADFLTSLVVWVKDDELWIELGDLDARMSDDPNDKPREPVRGKSVGGFRVVKTLGVRPVGAHTVAADWSHPVFSKAAPRRTKKGGRQLRRTVLMEEAAPPDDGVEELSPEALRALADLEEERLDGTVTELEYKRRRREILNDGQ